MKWFKLRVVMNLTQKDAENIVESKGCYLLDTFKTKKGKLNIKFQCGHIQLMSLCSFENKKQYNCYECFRNRRNDKNATTKVEQELKENGCELLSTFKNNKTKITILCNCGHERISTYYLIKSNKLYKCYSCVKNSITGDDVKKHLEEKGCQLLSDYKTKGQITIMCKCGHERSSTFTNIKNHQQYKCIECTKLDTSLKISNSLKNKNEKNQNNNIYITCSVCHENKNSDKFHNKKAYTHNKSKICKECCNIRNNLNRESYTPIQIINDLLNSCRKTARSRKKKGRIECGEFNLTIQDIEDLIKKKIINVFIQVKN